MLTTRIKENIVKTLCSSLESREIDLSNSQNETAKETQRATETHANYKFKSTSSNRVQATEI